MSDTPFNRGIKAADRAKNRKDAEQRIKAARAKLARPDYIVETKGVTEQVLCKCGAVIQSLVPHETLRFNAMPLAVMAQMPLYTEVELIMDDGSRHVTALCRPCAETLDAEKAEAIYAADLARMSILEPSVLENDQWVKRKALGHRRVR
jgi:hypothetical protein